MPILNIYLPDDLYERVKDISKDKKYTDFKGNQAPSKFVQEVLRSYFGSKKILKMG